MPSPESTRLLHDVRRVAREVAAPSGAAFDRDARFSSESVAALRAQPRS